jgi:hypothetical protein
MLKKLPVLGGLANFCICLAFTNTPGVQLRNSKSKPLTDRIVLLESNQSQRMQDIG